MEREDARSMMLALINYAGPFSFFVTVSPADFNSAIMLRLSNEVETLDGDSDIVFKLPGHSERMRILARNPVAAASYYRALIESFFTHLVRLDPEHMTRKSGPGSANTRDEGLFGVPICFLGVTEIQGRGTPHLHAVITTDFSPTTIRTYIDRPDVREALAERLNSILQGHLPPDAEQFSERASPDSETCHEPTTAINDTRRKLHLSSIDINPDDPRPQLEQLEEQAAAALHPIMQHGYAMAFKTNQHSHSFTCHKGAVGKWRCRLSLPFATWQGRTCFLQLRVRTENDKFKVEALQKIHEGNFSEHCTYDAMSRWKDSRVIVLELHRPHKRSDECCRDLHESQHNPLSNWDASTLTQQEIADMQETWADLTEVGENGMVVTFSPLISAVMGCNTCVDPLGNMAQSKAITYYLIKYMTKDCASLTNVVSLIKAAHEHNSKYASRAEDAQADQRISKYLLTRLLNSLNNEEYASQAAALAITGFPSTVCSHLFSYCFVMSAVRACKRKHAVDEPFAIMHTVGDETNRANQMDGEVEDNDDAELLLSRDVDEDPDDDFAVAESRTITTSRDSKVTTVSQEDQYANRGPELENYSLYEYCAIVRDIKGADKDSDAVGTGRPKNARLRYGQLYARFGMDMQTLASKQSIPLLAGRAPPRHPGAFKDTGDWRRRADAFAAYVICLHRPWSLETGAPDIPLTWEALQDWVSTTLAPKSAGIVEKARLHWIRILAQGMTTSAKSLKMISAWRSRFAKRWSDQEKTLGNEKQYEVAGADLGAEIDPGAGAAVIDALRSIYNLLDPEAAECQAAQAAKAQIDTLHDCLDGVDGEWAAAPEIRATLRDDDARSIEVSDAILNSDDVTPSDQTANMHAPPSDEEIPHGGSAHPGLCADDYIDEGMGEMHIPGAHNWTAQQRDAIMRAIRWMREVDTAAAAPANAFDLHLS